MALHSIRVTAVITLCMVVWSASASYAQMHSANAADGGDPTGVTFFSGTSNPPGVSQINVGSTSPGYLNDISGGSSGGANGQVMIVGIPYEQTAVIGLAIHVSDTAGPSHSLSSLSDPALTDIVNDLNAATGGGVFPLTAYAFASPPAQLRSEMAALATGEVANAGLPFDILLAGQGPGLDGFYLTLLFSNEVGNLDGITALNVTDIGAVPEPGTAGLMMLGLALLLVWRRRTASSRRGVPPMCER